MSLPNKVQRVPESFGEMGKTINAIIDYLNKIETMEGGGGIEVVNGPLNIKVTLASANDGNTGSGLPAGSAGDMLYHNGTTWVVLAKPTVVTANPVLRHSGTAPYWEEPEDCEYTA